MKNNITELVFILDKSGSMSGLESDTIGGFNSLIENQKKKDGKCYVTTVLFDTDFSKVHDRVELSEIRKMTADDYIPGGCTALLDAIGSTVKHIANIHRYARPEDVPEHTVFAIMTDGLENASRCFSREEIKRMISHEQEKYGWEFLFLGANIDSVETACSMGINPQKAANYHADAVGTQISWQSIGKAVGRVRASRPLGSSWHDDIDADYLSRKK